MKKTTSATEIPVRPRYLAGGNWCGDAALTPLISPTWRNQHDEWANYHAFGDDGRLYVGFIPEYCEIVEPRGLWHIEARRHRLAPATWQAALSDDVPPEILAAFTTALAADADVGGACPPYLHRNDHPDTVWRTLADAGWLMSGAGFDACAFAPDGRVTVTYTPPRPGPGLAEAQERAWEVEVRPRSDSQTLWWAEFHSATPAHLIAAFTKALASPEPLWREERCLPAAVRASSLGA